MATKPAKLANKQKAIVKVIKEYAIRQEGPLFVAYDVRTNKKVTESTDRERCRHFAGFRHGYAPVAS